MSSGATCPAWEAEEALGEVLGELGGYGGGFCEEVLRDAERAGKVG